MESQGTEGPVTVRLRFPRLCILSAISMGFFILALGAMGFPLRDPFFLAGLCVMVVGFIPVFSLFGMAFFFTLQIGPSGLRSFGLSPRFESWEEITSVGIFMPFAFYMTRGPSFLSGFKPRIFLPKRWLVKNPEAFEQALECFAPQGHILRRVFLERQAPTAREWLYLAIEVVLGCALLVFLSYMR